MKFKKSAKNNLGPHDAGHAACATGSGEFRLYSLQLACFSAPHVLCTYAVVLEDYAALGQQEVGHLGVAKGIGVLNLSSKIGSFYAPF